jgi:hypothetical protein
MLLQFILDEYASKQPGSVKQEREVLAPSAGPHGTSSAPQSDFGKLIIGGAVAENTLRSYANSALLVYTGDACPALSYLCIVRHYTAFQVVVSLFLRLSALLESI